MVTPPVRGAAADGWVRPIAQVAPEEVAEAILKVLRTAFSIGRNQLTVEAARLLAYDRTRSRVGPAIDDAIGSLLERDVLLDTGGQIRIRD
jgi:hypothetical protein